MTGTRCTEEKISVINLLYGGLTLVVALFGIFYGDMRVNIFRPPACEVLITSKNFMNFHNVTSYISRPEVEKQLSLFVGKAGDEYIVVNGPKGVGKSTLVYSALANEPFGAIVLSYPSSSSEVFTDFAEQVCGISEKWKIKDVADVLKKAVQLGRIKSKVSNWVPTLAIAVDRATEQSIGEIASDVKLLCIDYGLCRGIIVLSDPLSELALPSDPRIEMLWVEDFSLDEANFYLDKLEFLLDNDATCGKECNTKNQDLRQYIFTYLGTRPIELILLFNKVYHDVSLVKPYILGKIEECRRELNALMEFQDTPSGEKEFTVLAKQILSSPDLMVEVALSNLPDVKKVAPILKKYHAIMFHQPTQSYKFASQCFVHAAREILKSKTFKISFW